MTTAADIINRGLRQLRIVDIDSTADSTQLANGLIVLNGLVDHLNAERATLYEDQPESAFALTGATSYNIATGQTFNTVRPERIVSAYYSLNSVDYAPLKIITKEEWDRIQGKTDAGAPEVLWYDPAYPTGVIHLWPNPASGSLLMTTVKQLTEFAATSTTVSLPAGYRDMLTYNFSVRYSPEGGILTPKIEQLANETLAAVKRRNRQLTAEMINESAWLGYRASAANILQG
jgi:hypothetical protein